MKTKHWLRAAAAGACLVAAVLSHTGAGRLRAQGNGATKLNCDTQPCESVARGRAAFNDRNLRDLGANGRACADCHMPSEAFQLSPSAARARFEALMAKRANDKNADDPLFRPIDADDFRVNGDSASDFSTSSKRLVRDDATARERRLDRSRTGQPTAGRQSISGVRSFRFSMSPSRGRTVSCRSGHRGLRASRSWLRIRMGRTGRADISTTRDLRRCRSRREGRSSPTLRRRSSLLRRCSTISRRSRRHCFHRPESSVWQMRSSPVRPQLIRIPS